MLTFINAPSDYTFNVSVSTTTYETKEDFKAASKNLVYQKQPVSINAMCKLIRDGHSFCHCYDDDDEPFGNSTKTKENFRYTSFVAFDIDDSAVTMEDYISTLTYKPTISYTTTSDGLEGKGYRYRLIYCFNGKLKGNEQYEGVFWTLKEECGMELKDKCTSGTHQPIFGNALPSCRMVCSNLIYGIPLTEKKGLSVTRGKDKVSKQIIKERAESVINCDETFLKEFFEQPLWKFVSNYCKKYKRIEESELEFHNGYADIDDAYIRIYRSWDREKRGYRVWKDGENRRRKLSLIALLIRKIKPDITPEHLIYCLAYEVIHYYDNSDGVLNQAFIMRVVKSTLSKPIEDIVLKGRDKRKFAIDKGYWESLGISSKAAVPKVRAIRNDNRIGNLFDPSLTDKQNIELMAKCGVKVSESSLKRWRKKHGIAKYHKEK